MAEALPRRVGAVSVYADRDACRRSAGTIFILDIGSWPRTRVATGVGHRKFRTSSPSTQRTGKYESERGRGWKRPSLCRIKFRPNSGGAMSRPTKVLRDLIPPDPPSPRPRGRRLSWDELTLQCLSSLTASCFVLRYLCISQSAHCDEANRMTPCAPRAKVRCVSHTSQRRASAGCARAMGRHSNGGLAGKR